MTLWDDRTRELAKTLEGPILILGASGFVGSNLYHQLKQIRDDVHGASKDIHRSWRLIGSSEKDFSQIHQFDITCPNQLRELFNQVQPKTVFNLTAYGGYSWQTDVQRIYSVNFTGVLHLVRELCERPGVVLVHAGSSSEYGLNSDAPEESAPCHPNSDYGLSKLQASSLIELYARRGLITAVTLRLYSVYGPFEEQGRLIPALVQAGISKKFPRLSDKTLNRDFVYIDDATRAFILAAQRDCTLDPGECLNIASGISTSIEELSGLAREIFEIAEDPLFGSFPPRPWEVRHWRGLPEKARRKLGWQPTVTLRLGLERTRDWELERRKKQFSPSISSSAGRRKISVVIACYRDEEAIPILHHQLSRVFDGLKDFEGEFIFVNDGSPGADEAAIQRCSEKDLRVIGISHTRNFGSQSAFLSGLRIATGDAVILMDGDLQDPPELIPKLIEKWLSGAEIVTAKRVARVGQPIFTIFAKIFYRLFSMLVDFKIPNDAGDFSLLGRRVVSALAESPETDLFIRGLRAWTGYRQDSVDYSRPKRVFGTSTNSWFKLLGWSRRAFFNFSLRPIGLIYGFSFLSLILSPLLWCYQASFGFQAFTTGVVLLSCAWIGEYAGRAFFETKKRPQYVVDRLVIAGKIQPKPTEIHSRSKV
ncbi:MAG: NAD-dependent epimerase/dehydratase family protein [Bdellovibrionales bacterium]|nr:NAD-dependent epimerase/dehydratase family protein [Bdellovibrionales bacterium]